MTPEELNNEISKVKAAGSKLTEDQIKAIILKKEAGKLKRDKRSAKKWDERIAVKNMELNTIEDMGEYNRRNARKNLPSSMR